MLSGIQELKRHATIEACKMIFCNTLLTYSSELWVVHTFFLGKAVSGLLSTHAQKFGRACLTFPMDFHYDYSSSFENPLLLLTQWSPLSLILVKLMPLTADVLGLLILHFSIRPLIFPIYFFPITHNFAYNGT